MSMKDISKMDYFFFSSKRRHTRLQGDWSSDVCSSDLSIELYLDANQIISYPKSGTSWKDISGEGRNGTLTNGVTFNSDGYMNFDGEDDYRSEERRVGKGGVTRWSEQPGS